MKKRFNFTSALTVVLSSALIAMTIMILISVLMQVILV